MIAPLFSDYLTFLRVLGWAMATIVCWLAAGAPRMPPRRSGLALALFGAAQLSFGIGGFFHYDALSFGAALGGWLALAKLASFGFLREFGRALSRESRGGMTSWRTHAPLLAAVGLTALGLLFPGRAEWAARLGELGLLLIPPLICADAIWQLVRWENAKGEATRGRLVLASRPVFALAMVYVGICALLATRPQTPVWVETLQPLVPWVLAGSLGWSNLRVTGARGLLTAIFALTLASVVLAVPLTGRLFVAADARALFVAGGLTAVFCAAGLVFIWWQALAMAQQLAAAKREAASRAKTEFLAFLGHELRTPLQAILGRAELLRDGDDPVARAAAVATIAAEGRVMLNLVNDLLDLGAIEAGRFELRPQAFSLRAMFASVADTHRANARAKGLEFEFIVAEDLPEGILGDEARWRQIVGNLLGNGVKYTMGGRVELCVTREPIRVGDPAGSIRVRIIVRDTGIGLPPEKIPQLFTLFTRIDRRGVAAREGAGVGLALVKRLVDLMGGNVKAANRADGLGAEFAVELFVRAADLPLASSSATGTAVGRRSQRVLVVEDHPATREVLVDILRSLGHVPAAATDGVAMRIALAAEEFDAVVLDVNLPDADGVQLAAEIVRCRGSKTQPRVVGCSADAQPGTKAAALAGGMDAFCAKPVNRATLAAALGGPIENGSDLFAVICADDVAGAARGRTRAALPDECDTIRRAAQAGDWEEVRRRAHHLRNSALVVGEPALASAAQAVERAAAPANAPAMPAALRDLADLVPGEFLHSAQVLGGPSERS